MVVCLAAFIWGRGPERVIAAVWFIFFKIVAGVYVGFLVASPKVTVVDPVLAAIDLGALVVFIAIAVNANRNYPLWIAGLQVLAMTAHVARGLTETISPIAYVTMVIAPGWIQLFILGAGVIRHRRREKQFGRYREWRVPVRFGGLLPASKYSF